MHSITTLAIMLIDTSISLQLFVILVLLCMHMQDTLNNDYSQAYSIDTLDCTHSIGRGWCFQQ